MAMAHSGRARPRRAMPCRRQARPNRSAHWPHWWRATRAQARLGEDAQSPEWAAQVRAELHESMNTIHRCIEANLAMKQKALARLDPPDTKMRKFRTPDALMRFLQSL